MAERTVEQLVEDIKNARERLDAASQKAVAADSIKSLADKMGVKFDDSKKSKDYYSKILDAIVVAVTLKLNEEIEGLKSQLADETRTAQEQLEARQKFQKESEEFSSQLIAAQATIEKIKPLAESAGEKVELIAKLQAQVAEDETVKARLEETIRKHEEEIAARRDTVIACQAQIEALKEINKSLSEENTTLKSSNETLTNDNKRLTSENEELNSSNRSIKEVATSNIYAEIEAMIVDVFRKHGYKVSPHSISDENSKENDRQFELFKAVKAAQRADKKAEKSVKAGEAVIYPEFGYKKIEQELIKNYTDIISKFTTSHPELVEDFVATHATDDAKDDGKVTDEEMLKIILDKEQSQGGIVGFIKTTSGKVLSVCLSVVFLALVGISVLFGAGKAQAVAELDTAQDKFDSALVELDETKDLLGNKDSELQDKQNQLDAAQQQIEQIKNGFLAGDIATIQVSADEFNTYKSLLTSAQGGAVRGIQSCQYNKASGKVEILLNCVSSSRKEVTDLVTFTIDMSNVSTNIKDGTSLFDFATIMDLMQSSSDYQRSSYSLMDDKSVSANTNNGEVAVYSSSKVMKNGDMATITCQVMLVTTDSNGDVVDVETFNKSKTLIAPTDLNEAKERLLEELFTDIGVTTIAYQPTI